MRNLLLYLLFILYVDVICALRHLCKKFNNDSPAIKLKDYLLCEYDAELRPVKDNKNTTFVTMDMLVMFIHYQQETEAFDVHTWTALMWDDTHLTWDPANYGNLELIYLPLYKIWVPDITLYNTHTEENLITEKAKCLASMDGEVNWFFPMKYSTYCMADNTWWPYNVLNCSIHFGSWAYHDNEIHFEGPKNLSSMISLSQYRKNMEWDLLRVDVSTREEEHKYDLNSTVRVISFHFLLKRHWGIVHIVYVTPVIVLMMMTLATLWLEPKSYERMALASLNFVCHLLCIENVHWEMPRSGNTPVLITVYERSLLLALFALIVTNILRQLQELTTEPPAWVSAATTSIVRSRLGQILLVSILDPAVTAKIEVFADDNADLVQSSIIKKSPWSYITVLIGWFAFLGVLFAYALLFATCFPTEFTPNI